MNFLEHHLFEEASFLEFLAVFTTSFHLAINGLLNVVFQQRH